MKRLITGLLWIAITMFAFVAANIAMLALAASLDLTAGVAPQFSVPAFLMLFIVAFAFLAARRLKQARGVDESSAEAEQSLPSYPVGIRPRRAAVFLSAIVVRRRMAERRTDTERSVYSEASF